MVPKILGPYCSKNEVLNVLQELRQKQVMVYSSTATLVDDSMNLIELKNLDLSIQETIRDTRINLGIENFVFIIVEEKENVLEYTDFPPAEPMNDAEYPRNEYIIDRDEEKTKSLSKEDLQDGTCDI